MEFILLRELLRKPYMKCQARKKGKEKHSNAEKVKNVCLEASKWRKVQILVLCVDIYILMVIIISFVHDGARCRRRILWNERNSIHFYVYSFNLVQFEMKIEKIPFSLNPQPNVAVHFWICSHISFYHPHIYKQRNN